MAILEDRARLADAKQAMLSSADSTMVSAIKGHGGLRSIRSWSPSFKRMYPARKRGPSATRRTDDDPIGSQRSPSSEPSTLKLTKTDTFPCRIAIEKPSTLVAVLKIIMPFKTSSMVKL